MAFGFKLTILFKVVIFIFKFWQISVLVNPELIIFSAFKALSFLVSFLFLLTHDLFLSDSSKISLSITILVFKILFRYFLQYVVKFFNK